MRVIVNHVQTAKAPTIGQPVADEIQTSFGLAPIGTGRGLRSSRLANSAERGRNAIFVIH